MCFENMGEPWCVAFGAAAGEGGYLIVIFFNFALFPAGSTYRGFAGFAASEFCRIVQCSRAACLSLLMKCVIEYHRMECVSGQLEAIRSSSLARVICDNTEIEEIQPSVLGAQDIFEQVH